MNYLLKTKPKKNSSFRRGLATVSIVLAVILILFATQSTLISGAVTPFARVVWKTGNLASSFAGSHFGYFKSKKNLMEENANLKEMVRDLSGITLERDMLRAENVGLKSIDPVRGEIARVLTSPAQSFYDIIFAELPPGSAVQEGDKVYGEHSALLGTVINLSGRIAKIELFSSSGRQSTVRLLPYGTELILTGRGGGNFIVVVPSAFEAAPGDLFISPSLVSGIVAVLGSIEEARNDSFKNIHASSPVNLFSLQWVRISKE